MSKLFIVDFFDGINSTSLNELRKKKAEDATGVERELRTVISPSM